jgi:hypothetical protein
MNTEEAGDGAADQRIADQWGILTPQIDFLVDQVARLHGQPHHVPGTALAGDDRALAPYSVTTDVWRLIEQATSHLHACRELVVNGIAIEQGPCFALIRACIETAATGYWLIQPSSRDERVERFLRWRIRDRRNALEGFKDLMKVDRPDIQRGIDELIGIAEARPGLDHEGIRMGSLRISSIVADVDHHVETQLPLTFAWREASAHAHGWPWADIRWGAIPLDASKLEVIPLVTAASRTIGPAMGAIRLVYDSINLFTMRAGLACIDGYAERRAGIRSLFGT